MRRKEFQESIAMGDIVTYRNTQYVFGGYSPETCDFCGQKREASYFSCEDCLGELILKSDRGEILECGTLHGKMQVTIKEKILSEELFEI